MALILFSANGNVQYWFLWSDYFDVLLDVFLKIRRIHIFQMNTLFIMLILYSLQPLFSSMKYI